MEIDKYTKLLLQLCKYLLIAFCSYLVIKLLLFTAVVGSYFMIFHNLTHLDIADTTEIVGD